MRVKSYRIFALLSYMLFIVVSTSGAVAPDASTLTSFEVVMQKLEVSQDGGNKIFTIFDSNTTVVDLVAISGSSVGTFIGEAAVPAGTYNWSRVTVTRTDATWNVTVGGNSGSVSMPTYTTTVIDTNTSMSVIVPPDGSVNGIINMDAGTSYSSLDVIELGAGSFQFNNVTIAPVISVISE